jgi:type VI secretion system secreted protein Hcp
MAQVDYFLKLDGIEGESTDAKHKGEIEIESFSFGASNPASAATGGGGGAGRVQFQDFHFSSTISKASPSLFVKCATGAHIKEGVIVARKAGETPVEFLHIKLTDVLVSSYSSGGNDQSLPADQFSLNFAKVVFSFTSQDPKGGPAGTLTTGFDLKSNKAV